MPKIIQNLKEKLLQEAVRQIREQGYSAMTIQSVAKNCGVGVGTVYNYVTSKDALLALHIGQEWTKCVTAMNAVSRASDSCDAVIRCIYDQLLQFGMDHKYLAEDSGAANVMASLQFRMMGMVTEQIAKPLRKFCKSDKEAQMIAEALLMWTRMGKSYEDVYEKIMKLL